MLLGQQTQSIRILNLFATCAGVKYARQPAKEDYHMSLKTVLGVLLASILILASAAAPSAKAVPPDDACSLLTPAQVSVTAGVPMKAGQYVTPTKKETCTWAATKPTEKSTKMVTLMIEGLDMFQSTRTSLVKTIIVTPVSGLGDEARYVTLSTNVVLHVKKGSVALRITVYADLPVEAKQAMEKTLALQVLSKL
jgi:hypothetical protein